MLTRPCRSISRIKIFSRRGRRGSAEVEQFLCEISAGEPASVGASAVNPVTMISHSSEQTHTLPKPVVEKLKAVLGERNVLTERDELLVYETDALTLHKLPPSAVIIPGNAEEVAAAVQHSCAREYSLHAARRRHRTFRRLAFDVRLGYRRACAAQSHSQARL